MPEDLLTPSMPDEIKPLSDDPWQTAQMHAANVTGGVRMTIASCIALGMELNLLKVELGYVRGRPSKEKSSPKVNLKPWPEMVADKTGFSYKRCQEFMKTAEAVRGLFLKSRKKKDAPVKQLVTNPPRAWNRGDYAIFAEGVAEHFEASSFKDLMLETGIMKPPKPPKEDETKDEEKDDSTYTAQMAANDTVGTAVCSLADTMASPESFIRHLDQLPLETQEEDEAAGIPAIIGLLAVQKILDDARALVLNEIETKRQAAKKS